MVIDLMMLLLMILMKTWVMTMMKTQVPMRSMEPAGVGWPAYINDLVDLSSRIEIQSSTIVTCHTHTMHSKRDSSERL